jgi:outer membrane protein assembly factor BamC
MSLSSCSALFGRHGFFRDRGDDYVKANEIPPMKVPASLDAGAISELYVIPTISNEYVDTEAEFEAPKPDFKSAVDQSQVRIQKLDQQRWIAINVSPSEIWPRVQHFLVESRIGTASADPATGKIETVWLTPLGNSTSHDRYQISVEQGLRSNACEIHVIHLAVDGVVPGSGKVDWPAASTDREKEKWLLDTLAKYLTQEDKSGASLLAQSVGGSQKVEFMQPLQTEPFLSFTLDKARTWASVGGALKQFPFVITNSDSTSGKYSISYDPKPLDMGKPGFFCRLTGCKKREQAAREQGLQHYWVLMDNPDEQHCRVFVRSESGKALPAHDAEKVLSLIKKQLV